MRLLVNENIGRSLLEELRNRGHDVLSAKETLRGESDPVILARAQAEDRIVVTQDKDFGELAFHAKLPATSGIILFRPGDAGSEADNLRLVEALESRDDWAGHFSVVTSDRIRMRPLPDIKYP